MHKACVPPLFALWQMPGVTCTVLSSCFLQPRVRVGLANEAMAKNSNFLVPVHRAFHSGLRSCPFVMAGARNNLLLICKRLCTDWFPQQLPDGTYHIPQTVTELMEAVHRNNLDPSRFWMMHVGLTPWTEISKAIAAAEGRDTPNGSLQWKLFSGQELRSSSLHVSLFRPAIMPGALLNCTSANRYASLLPLVSRALA